MKRKIFILSICIAFALAAKSQYTTPATCLAVVKKNGKQGLLDCKGTLVAPLMYDTIILQKNGYSIAATATQKGIITPAGKSILLDGVKKVAGLSNGVLRVELANDRHAYYDTTGKKLFSQDYAKGEDFHAGVALVYTKKTGNEYTGAQYINKKGETIFTLKTTDREHSFLIGDMHDGLARIDIYTNSHPDKSYSPTGPSGFIDTAGKIAIEPAFLITVAYIMGINNTDEYNFKGDYCIMPDCKSDYHCSRLGYIDREGNWKKRQLYSAYPFDSNGLAFYSDSLGAGFLKKDFTSLFPRDKYTKVQGSFGGGNVSALYLEDMIPVMKKDNFVYGYLKLDGSEAFFVEKNMYVTNYHNGVAMVTKRNEKNEVLYALVDKKGNFTTEFTKLPSQIYHFLPVPTTGVVIHDTDSSYQLKLHNTVVQNIKKERGSFFMGTTSCGLLTLKKAFHMGSGMGGRRFFNETTGQEIGTEYTFVTDFIEVYPETINKTDINKLDFNSAQIIKYIEKYSKD